MVNEQEVIKFGKKIRAVKVKLSIVQEEIKKKTLLKPDKIQNIIESRIKTDER